MAQAVHLADIAAALGLPIVGTEQNPAGLGPNVESLRQRCASTLAKMRFDACEDGLLETLRGDGPAASAAEVVIAGCEAHVCLLQTALGLLDAGLKVWVVSGACGSRAAANHALAMQRLQQAGAGIVSAEMVAFEWLGSCEHQRFRQVLKLLKEAPA